MQDRLQKILTFVHAMEKLKTIQRQVSISDNSRKESPAEHTWRTALLAMVLCREFELAVDLTRVLEIILVHDIVEIIADDHWNIHDDGNVHAIKNKQEKDAADDLYGILPERSQEELKEMWVEYRDRKTDEARFAYALDKIEVMIQRIDLGAQNWEKREWVEDGICEKIHAWADDAVFQCHDTKLDIFLRFVKEEIDRECKKISVKS